MSAYRSSLFRQFEERGVRKITTGMTGLWAGPSFIARRRFLNPSMSALPIIAKQNSPSVGLFTRQQGALSYNKDSMFKGEALERTGHHSIGQRLLLYPVLYPVTHQCIGQWCCQSSPEVALGQDNSHLQVLHSPRMHCLLLLYPCCYSTIVATIVVQHSIVQEACSFKGFALEHPTFRVVFCVFDEEPPHTTGVPPRLAPTAP